MLKFSLHSKETAPEGSQETLAIVEERFGFIPNVLAQMAAEPAALNANVQLLGLLDSSTLELEEQWIVLLTAAYENSSGYCVAANSTVASFAKVRPEIINDLRDGKPLSEPKLEALRAFAAEMVRERGRVSAATTGRFLAAGYSPSQVFAVILGVATETMASYADRVAGVPMDEQFSPFAWSGPKSGAARQGGEA